MVEGGRNWSRMFTIVCSPAPTPSPLPLLSALELIYPAQSAPLSPQDEYDVRPPATSMIDDPSFDGATAFASDRRYTLPEILADHLLIEEFMKFLKKQHASENLLCYMQLIEYVTKPLMQRSFSCFPIPSLVSLPAAARARTNSCTYVYTRHTRDL